MLTRLIVASYAWLLEIALWLTLVLACVAGYHVTVPILEHVGGVPLYPLAWKLFGAVVCPVIAFLVLAVFAGPVLVLLDIRQAVRHAAAKLERGSREREDLPDMRYTRNREDPTL